MCGIAGVFRPSADRDGNTLGSWTRVMADSMLHRGPDAGGVWHEESSGVSLGHRRLSILELSPQGAQPMLSPSGRFVLSFNGEIYNHMEIRSELGRSGWGPAWRGRSDTETMLAAFEAFGFEGALERFSGMFAFGLWDRKERRLHLAVDRLGEKPLYYGWVDGTLLFASELKALETHPGWKGDIDRNAIALLLRFNYIPAPYCIYKGVRKLLPGTTIAFPGAADPVPYWSVREAVRRGRSAPFEGSEQEAVDELDRRLRKAVAGRMEADVPLGAFLSGGIDSSAVVGAMQAQSRRPVKTFTIGFSQDGYDEAASARAVARHLGTDHTELRLEWEAALGIIPRLAELYDEPFSDSSQIPTFLVSRLARSQVTVSLSGDGGDELFGGYNRYSWGGAVWNRTGWIPRPLRRGAASALAAFSPSSWEAAFKGLSAVLPKKLRVRHPGEKIHKLAENLDAADPMEMYRGFVSHWRDPASVVIGSEEPPTFLDGKAEWPELDSAAEVMMYLDMIGYLPGDILTKVDRASMGVSLESRVPFLDHALVEFAWSLPLSVKIRGDQGKWILRQVLHRYVPRELVERPKMGFAIPLHDWLRGPLRDWAESLLSRERLVREGFLRPEPILRRWREHLSGKRNWEHSLWDVLMFQEWLARRS